jgi:hypothetical protein
MHTRKLIPATNERACVRESRRPAIKLDRLGQAKLVTGTLDRCDSQIAESLQTET